MFEGFDFDLRKGEIHCICGENGAGKSTLIKILSGAHAPDRGTIFFEGREIQNLTPHAAMQMGIQTIYQEHNLFPLLDVVENLYAGNQITSGLVIDRPTMLAKTREILAYLHSDVSPFDIVGKLSTSARKVIEIAKALVQEAKVIIFDEPTASFSQVEIDHLFEIIRTAGGEQEERHLHLPPPGGGLPAGGPRDRHSRREKGHPRPRSRT